MMNPDEISNPQALTISVIVPSYRRPSDLRRCVQAILRGQRLPEELLVVLRGTDLESQAVVADLQAAEGNGYLLQKIVVTTPGQVAAINQGLQASQGEVIVLTDDDTEPTAGWLIRLAEGYRDPQVVGVGGRDRVAGSPDTEPAQQVGLVTWYGKIIGNHHRGCVGGRRRVHHLKGANMSFRRSALPPFDPNLFRAASAFNDTSASLGAGQQGIIFYDPSAIVEHYPAERGAGITRTSSEPVIVRADSHNLIYCLLKHLPWWGKLIALIYQLLVGQGECLGLVKWLALYLAQRPKPWRQVWASTLGKLEGLRSYVVSQGGRRALLEMETEDAS